MTVESIFESPVGKLSVSFSDDCLCKLEIDRENIEQVEVRGGAVKVLRKELDAYFSDMQSPFTIPVQLNGTDFQKRVWSELRKIPAGHTLSYGELAEKLHSNPRAIGNACRANPVPIVIPCHRVIGKNGIGGYDGKTSGRRLAIKRWLLQHEGININ